MKLKSKLPSIGTNIFSVMSGLAREYNAINLSQGFPDFPISDTLISLVHEAMQQGHNQYAPMIGLPELRNALVAKIESLYNTKLNPDDEITITPGATYGIYTAFATTLEAGDEVIVLEPAYDSYLPNIESMGAKAICVPLTAPTFSIDWEKVRKAIGSKTKAIIINSPHNPTGYVWSQDDFSQLKDLVANTSIILISDEVYEHITFDGRSHHSIIQYPELYERAFVIFSFGKVFHTTGWKMGYCVAPPALSAEFRKIHQFICFTTNTPMQLALAKFLSNENEYLSISSLFEGKRNYFLDHIKALPFTLYEKAQGTYFQTLGYEQISSLPDTEFARWLTKEIGVACIPVSAFYKSGIDDKLVRFCFAKKDDTLQMALERLQKLL